MTNNIEKEKEELIARIFEEYYDKVIEQVLHRYSLLNPLNEIYISLQDIDDMIQDISEELANVYNNMLEIEEYEPYTKYKTDKEEIYNKYKRKLEMILLLKINEINRFHDNKIIII